MDSTPSDATVSRRDFALCLGGLTGFAAVSEVAAQEEKKQPAAQAIADVQELLCRQKLGTILNAEQIQRIARTVVSRRAGAESLKKVPLSNGDDPAEAFRADLP